jgi:hypothetical protein
MPVVRNEAPWGFPLEIESDKRIEVLVDKFDFSRVPENTIRIVVMDEPINAIIDDVSVHTECYTYVFTFFSEVLASNPKAVFFHGIYRWVDHIKTYDKKFAISTVVGAKDNPVFEGYALRHELWRRQDEIATPKNFYLSHDYKPRGVDRSKCLILGDGRWAKEQMFDCMFHICIENTSIPNYFSEKILDCFLTKTVPLYIGCPNIGDFFDVRGLFQFETISSVIDICNMLDTIDYKSLKYFIDKNYYYALKYVNWENSLKETILKLL